MVVAAAVGTAVRRLVRIAALAFAAVSGPALAATHLLVIGGIGGEPRYDKLFQQQLDRIAQAGRTRLAKPGKVVALSGTAATRETITRAFADVARGMRATDNAIVVLLGHGSFDTEQYRFNIAGPDLTGAELQQLFETLPTQRQLIVNATSSSGAVAELWRSEERLIITATRSGNERNATRFGEHFAAALTGSEADTDKSGELSARELFDFATRKVADSYRDNGALATEHARIEGDFAEAFVVLPLRAAATVDAAAAALLEQRALLEREIALLRSRRDVIDEDDYLEGLEDLMRRLAELQQRIDQATQPGQGQTPEPATPAETSNDGPR